MSDHRIHSLQFDFSFASKQQALHAQMELKNLINDQFLPKLESFFSSLVPEEIVFQMDRLEIDLGTIFWSEFTRGEALQAALEESVETNLRNNRNSSKKNATLDEGSAGVFTLNSPLPTAWLTTPKIHAKSLFFFLETGLLPWWAEPIKPVELLTETLKNNPLDLLAFLKEKLSDGVFDGVLNRLIKQFPKKMLGQVLALMDKEKFEVFQRLEEDFKVLKINELNTFFYKKECFYLFFKPNQNIKDFSLKVIFQHFHKSNPTQPQLFNQKTLKTIAQELKNLAPKSLLLGWLAEDIKTKLFSEKEPPSIATATTTNELEKIQQALAAGVFIHSAGLVILSPFLSAFFKKIGLVVGREFVSNTSQERAVMLCYFLVTGQLEVVEHETILAKILCGMSMQTPIDSHLELTELEQVEIEDLLQTVIQHWGALGRTSIAGFQQAFLQRMGKLTVTENAIFIKIERLGRDVLLEKLPWGIGFIRLPWMEKPLEVEW